MTSEKDLRYINSLAKEAAYLDAQVATLREENAKLRAYLRAVRQDLLTIEDTAARPGVVALARSAGMFIDESLKDANAALRGDRPDGATS